ncbi:MAG: rhodanese-like domain-containing protein [Deltaproteobacteria bacterium]|nr:rhodanese-like domain-containing protein [Deltaproteobacteria bacterium]
MHERWAVTDAAAAMAAGTLVYIDIRSTAEVEQGLPAGAYHVPLFDAGPFGMVPNGNFAAEVAAVLAEVAPTRCAVACAHGVRSRQAVGLLAMAGIEVDEVPGGWDGLRDGWGGVVAPGWSHASLPVEARPAAGRDHASIRLRVAE